MSNEKIVLNTDHITYESLLEGNKKWAEETLNEDPQYFERLASGQKPPVLWIGCADSRVPANQVTGTQPGEIFVHRNIANVIVHTDMNMLSVVDYAVNVLKVKHIIVCGHYGCGGVIAAMQNKQFGLIDNWLRSIKEVYKNNCEELESIEDDGLKTKKLVELNVSTGVENLSKTSIVQNAWSNGQDLNIHGWVIDLETGLIKDLKVSFDMEDKNKHVFRVV